MGTTVHATTATPPSRASGGAARCATPAARHRRTP
jgi:hypothetical protein